LKAGAVVVRVDGCWTCVSFR